MVSAAIGVAMFTTVSVLPAAAGWPDAEATETGTTLAVVASRGLVPEVGSTGVLLFAVEATDSIDDAVESNPDAVYRTGSFKALPKETTTLVAGGKAAAMSAVRDNCTEDEELAVFRLCTA